MSAVAPALDVRYVATETCARFIESTAFVNELIGPRREGKTTAGLYRLIRVAQRATDPSALPLHVAVIRDTYQNLIDKFVPSLRQEANRSGLAIDGLDQAAPRLLKIGRLVALQLFGMDTLPDANKFQGLGIGLAWLEEPAPAADLTSGVPAEVFGLAASSLSQPGFPPSVQITMNPPDEEHWTLKIVEYFRELEHAVVDVAQFWIPPGENPHLDGGFRDRARESLLAVGREDLVHRLIEGKVGSVQLGLAVSPEYRDHQHVAPKPFVWLPGEIDSFRFWDFALNPTCVIGQLTPRGIFRVYASLILHNRGLEQLIKTVYLPWASRNRIPPSQRWRDIGDPAGATPEGSNSDRSCVETLYRLLHASFEPGPVDWPARRDSIRGALTRMIDGVALVQINPVPETKTLRDALRGGWHYFRDASGRVRDKPVKDEHSHPGDAFGYGLARVFPELARALEDRRPRREGYPGWRQVRGMREPEPAGRTSWMSA